MKKAIKYLALFFLPLFVLSGCLVTAVPPGGCRGDGDCPVNTFCTNSGGCAIAEDFACDDDGDCPNTTACDIPAGHCYQL